ncbi:MAG TPA: radical SAM protein [Candidatus Limnocylindrales bacterium]|nr:radical SAM protein [Candidatus Limnocylindrales bacterium]
MRYEGRIFRPPSEADAYILQATVGCSWNHCTYCDMYRDKTFRVRDLDETLRDVAEAGRRFGTRVEKLFVADGDALILSMQHWERILTAARGAFPAMRRASCYATAINILEKTPQELRRLRELGLSLLYIGPESGDDVTLKRIAKGASFDDHAEAARRAHEAGMAVSAIFLLGAGGIDRSEVHAHESARLATAMDPDFLSALTLTVVEGTPMATLEERGSFTLPPVETMLRELRTIVDEARPTDAVFRTNHASNYLPLAGNLPRDRERIVAVLDDALAGRVRLRPESARGL